MGGAALTLGYQYDVSGNRTRVTHPDGVYFAYEYDDSSRQTVIRENGGTVAATITYDAQGRRSGDTRGGVASGYEYDAISRPVGLTDNLAGTVDDVTTGFGYNAASQIIRKERNNNAYAFNGYVDIDRSYGINGLNQYTSSGPASLGYDNNGNLTSDGAGNSFGYDSENRLVSKNSALLLAYDPNGRLWQTSGGTTGTTRYLYDGDELVAEYGPAGAVLKRYVHGAGADDPILWYEGAGLSDRRSLQIDSQGSIVSVADAAGNRIAINAYDEYGIPNGFDNVHTPNLGRFQYTGQIWLPDLGMYYYKARIYSPSLGRFLQTDPIGYKDQVNLYAYVGNDPIGGKDPTGREIIVNGSDKDKKQFVAQVYQLTGVRTSIGKGGVLSTSGTRDTKVGSAVTAKSLQDGISSKAVTTMNLVNQSGTVMIDSFKTNEVDIADIEAFSKKDVRFGAAALTHIIEERQISVTHNLPFDSAHAYALGEEAAVFGAVARRDLVLPNSYSTSYVDNAGKTVATFSLIIDNNGNIK